MDGGAGGGVDGGAGGERVAASLTGWLARLEFTDLGTDEVTARIIDAVLAWAAEQGWRSYRRAASVLPLPPPMTDRHSVLDVACARRDGPPVVIEVDHTDRRRTWEKLTAEAAAGRVALWVRWGPGRFAVPPAPIHLVTCEVSRHAGPAGAGRRHSRASGPARPAPVHSARDVDPVVEPLPLPPVESGS
ncbi:hypothetical protein ACQP1S_17155 [Micromonospora matsumotoense]|uniref:hypothetical protein n=1 Tax=Micromonospora matsumotoense TaxID=121616 RepID=UPI003D8AF10A